MSNLVEALSKRQYVPIAKYVVMAETDPKRNLIE